MPTAKSWRLGGSQLMQMNRVVIAAYVTKKSECRYLASGTRVAHVRVGGELPIRGWQWRNTGTHELAQPQFLRKACRRRPGSREGRQRVRGLPDRAAPARSA